MAGVAVSGSSLQATPSRCGPPPPHLSYACCTVSVRSSITVAGAGAGARQCPISGTPKHVSSCRRLDSRSWPGSLGPSIRRGKGGTPCGPTAVCCRRAGRCIVQQGASAPLPSTDPAGRLSRLKVPAMMPGQVDERMQAGVWNLGPGWMQFIRTPSLNRYAYSIWVLYHYLCMCMKSCSCQLSCLMCMPYSFTIIEVAVAVAVALAVANCCHGKVVIEEMHPFSSSFRLPFRKRYQEEKQTAATFYIFFSSRVLHTRSV